MQYNVFGSKHRSNVQGNEENCWSQKQTRKRRRISGFCRSIFFFGIKNLRVSGKILGSIGNTHIFFLPDAYILWFMFNMMLYWWHWQILDKHTMRNPFSQNKLTIVYIYEAISLMHTSYHWFLLACYLDVTDTTFTNPW